MIATPPNDLGLLFLWIDVISNIMTPDKEKMQQD